MKTYEGVDFHVFSNSALVGGEWLERCPGFISDKILSTCWVGGWECSRTGKGDMDKRKFLPLQGLEPRPLCCPVRSQSLTDCAIPQITIEEKK
jgi:hypothetical protein